MKDYAFALSIYKYHWTSQLYQLCKNYVIKNMTYIANIAHTSTHYTIKSITLKCINTYLTKINK